MYCLSSKPPTLSLSVYVYITPLTIHLKHVRSCRAPLIPPDTPLFSPLRHAHHTMAVAVLASQPALPSPPFDTMPHGTFEDDVEPSENDEGALSPRKGTSPSSDYSMSSAVSPVRCVL